MKLPLRLLLAFSIVSGSAPGLRAQTSGDSSLDFFQEEARVITAARRPQAQLDSPATVTVITREEIENAGVMNFWDLLRYRAGMDVYDARSLDGNRAVVSIRGFAEHYVDSMQVLVDGRSAYSALSGGTYWQQLPVQMQDIERIEIVRGPNAALYGSNAGLGVINFITKKAPENTFVRVEASGGNRDVSKGAVAVGAGSETAGIRLSHTSSDRGGFPTSAGNEAHDAVQSQKSNLRLFWNPTRNLTLEAFAGLSIDDFKTPVAIAAVPSNHDRQHFQMIRGELKTGGRSAVDFMAARNDLLSKYGPIGLGDHPVVRTVQYDAEAQHRINWSDRFNTSWGASFREVFAEGSYIFVNGDPGAYIVNRLFLSQSARLTRRFTLAAAGSLEQNKLDNRRRESAYQAALLFQPTRRDTLRAQYALATTLAPIFNRRGAYNLGSALTIVGNPDIDPGIVRSYELSYQADRLEHSLQTNVALFYMDVNDIKTTYVQSMTFFPTFNRTISYANSNSAVARGAEAEAKLRLDGGHSLFANYTFETISDRQGIVHVKDGTPKHKLNVGGTAMLARGLSGTLIAGYKDGYSVESASGLSPVVDVPAYWRLDARLAYAFKNVELYVAGQNLTRPEHVESSEDLRVPRRYQAGFVAKFGKE